MALGSDPARFLMQGHWLMEGKGFLQANELPCTSLPPGYPVFLAALMCFSMNLQYLQWAQVVLHSSSGVILFLAMRKNTPSLAILTGVLVSGSPWGAAMSSMIMSETTGTFLSCCLVYLIAQVMQGTATKSTLFLAGFVMLANCLTCPGVSFTMAGLWCVMAFTVRAQVQQLAMLVAGALFPFCVWQMHCIETNGRPVWTLLTPWPHEEELSWIRTWARTPDEYVNGVSVFVWPNSEPNYASIPPYAYVNQTQRNRAEEITKRWRLSGGDRYLETAENLEKHRFFRQLAAQRIADTRLDYYFRLPFMRGIRTWTDLRPINYVGLADPQNISRLAPGNLVSDVRSYGLARASKRIGRGLLSLTVVIVHFTAIVYILFQIWTVIRNPNRFAVVMMLTVGIYTAAHGYTGGESRRNIPFFPLLFSAGCLAAAATFVRQSTKLEFAPNSAVTSNG